MVYGVNFIYYLSHGRNPKKYQKRRVEKGLFQTLGVSCKLLSCKFPTTSGQNVNETVVFVRLLISKTLLPQIR